MKSHSSQFLRLTLSLFLIAVFFSLFTFHVSLAAAGPDPGFIAASSSSFDAADIWVDSEVNGFDTYFAGVGSQGTPLATGDPIMPQHTTRVYVRVHNFGDVAARNVTVNIYTQTPAGIGDGQMWELIGTLNRLGTIQPKSFRDGFIEWTPVTATPTSIKAVIEPLANDVTNANNSVIENCFFFTAGQSLANLPEFDFLVHNPLDDSNIDVMFEAEVISSESAKTEAMQATNWQVLFNPQFRRLRRGGNCNVHVTILPPDACDTTNGAPAQIVLRGFFQRPGGTRQPLGGATIFARSTKPAELHLTCPEQALGVGTSLTMSGQLLERRCSDTAFAPLGLRNLPVALEYLSPTRRVTKRLLSTNAYGEFSDTFTPTSAGTWIVSAAWIGDGTHSSTEAFCSFEVEDASGCPAPVLAPIQDPITLFLDATVDVPLSVSNAAETCGPLFITISPELPFVQLIDNGNGTGLLHLTPGRSSLGTYQLTITATDSSGSPQSDSRTITINVYPG